jgi:hypothetical protein
MMNRIKSLLLLSLVPALMSVSLTAYAGGDKLTEGVITYSVDASTVEPQLAPFLENMALTFYFSGDNVRVETAMGAMGSTTVISSGKNTVTLMNMMGNKIAMTESMEETDAEVKVEYMDVTKTILGYECRKAIISAGGMDMTYWVTDKIQMPKVESNMLVDELNGHPLQMEINLGMAAVTMTATNIEKKKVAADRFDTTVPEGYQIMTAQEMMQLMGGMGQ